jgi:hypothetical protein
LFFEWNNWFKIDLHLFATRQPLCYLPLLHTHSSLPPLRLCGLALYPQTLKIHKNSPFLVASPYFCRPFIPPGGREQAWWPANPGEVSETMGRSPGPHFIRKQKDFEHETYISTA